MCYPHPFTQALSAGIVKRDSGFMDFSSRSLARDQDPRTEVHLKNGSRFMRQMRYAERARSNSRQ